MKPVILDDIRFEPDVDVLGDRLRIKPGSRQSAKFTALVDKARTLARPKALYRAVGYEIDGDKVTVDGIVMESWLLRRNLEKECMAYPFVATCGTELDEWSAGLDGMLERFWADGVKEAALSSALAACCDHIEANHHPGALAMMNPGSLQDWPISEQAKVFAALVEPIGTIGVSLTGSGMMIPVKSISGILFPSQEGFVNCRLCPREDCSSRMADYDPDYLAKC
jgi:hypothetical protein